MSKIWPSGEIKLYNIPQSDILNGRAVVFSSTDEREQWFEAYRIATESPVTVVKKKKNPIKVGIDIATVAQANYMSFKNPDFDNKLYYCIIKDYDYVNNNVTEVTFMIDWWYTDMFNVKFEMCHMAREGLNIREKHFLDIDPYDETYCEKMRSPENLAVNSDLEQAHYDLGNVASNIYDNIHPLPSFRRGDDGGDVLIEKDCQSNYGAGEAPTNDYGINNFPSSKKNEYKVYPYFKKGNVSTECDAWNDSSPLIPCIMFTPIDFKYLDAEYPEVRETFTDTGISDAWLKADTPTTYEVYSAGSSTIPSTRFKSLLNMIRTESSFYVMAFPRAGVNRMTDGLNEVSLITNCNWITSHDTGGTGRETSVKDAQVHYTKCLYPRPYYIIAANPWYIAANTPKFCNPIQEIIDLLTEWNMSSSILGVYMLPANLLRNTFDARFAAISNNNVINFCTSFQRKQDGHNYGSSPKLLQAPYSYLTVESSDGSSVCDYRYEDMAGNHLYNVGGQAITRNEVPFSVISEVNAGSIRIGVAPVNGKRKMKMRCLPNTNGSDTWSACDLQKLVSYDSFPQAPYTTDAYMSFLAGVNASLASQASKNNLIDIQRGLIDVNTNEESARFLEGAKKVGKAAAHAGTALIGMATHNPSLVVQGGAGLMGDTADIFRGENKQDKFYLQRQQLENQQAMIDDVGKGALSNLKGSVIADMYAKSTSAFAMRNYVAGTNGGISATNKLGMGQRLLYIHHKLRDDILTVYDNYFRVYGYTTSRYKLPAVAAYLVFGYADATDWNTLSDGQKQTPNWETFDSEEVFFTQCSKCYVEHVCDDSRNFIEALFEGGCRFVRPKMPSNS